MVLPSYKWLSGADIVQRYCVGMPHFVLGLGTLRAARDRASQEVYLVAESRVHIDRRSCNKAELGKYIIIKSLFNHISQYLARTVAGRNS